MPRFLKESDVLKMHDYLTEAYGGDNGLLDAGKLDSALSQPKAQFNGKFLHPTIPQMAAAYGYHLCQGHAFIDGNKRTARMAMLTFFARNGYDCTASEFDLYAVMLAIATGKMSKLEFTAWLQTVVRRNRC